MAIKKSKQPKTPKDNLPKFGQHIKGTFAFLWQEKKLFGGIAIIYAAVCYIFAGGITQQTFVQLKQAATALVSDNADSFGVSAMLLISSVSGEGQNGNGELYGFVGFMAFLVFWLVIIWTARMRMAGYAIKIRDALYNATGPLISSLLVVLVIAAQLLPAAIGLYVILLSQSGIWAQSAAEMWVVAVIGIALFAVSLYFIVSSSMALIIVSNAQAYPWLSLVAARKLVKGKRWNIFLRLFMLIIVLLLVWAVFLPGALLLAYTLRIDWLPLVPVTVQLLNAFSLVFGSIYIYRLYRTLL